MKSEENIVKLFQEGDPETLDYLYKVTFKNIEKYILANSGNSQDAQDIFNQALVQIYVKLKENKIQINSLYDYVFIVCRNLWRKEKSKTRVTNLEENTLLDNEEPDDASFYVEQERWELFNEYLKKLSKGCQDLLLLVFKGESYDSIVAKHDYSSGSVARQRVFKCKARLTKLIMSDNRFKNLSRIS